MSRDRWLRSGIVAILLIATSMAQPARAEDKEADLKQLLTQRRDTLQRLFGLVFDKIWVGNGSMSRVLEIQRDLLRANLELCSAPADRIAVLQNARDTAGKLYKRWQAEFTGNVIEVEQSKAAWVEIRIELLREELKAKPAKHTN